VNPNFRISVLLLVGNHLLCKSLARIIQQRSDIFAIEPGNLSDIALLITKSETDVILLDLASATALNRQCVARLRDLNPKARVLMIGMDVDECAFLKAVRFGVSGYLLNETSAVELISAIRAVARGEAVCPPQLCRALFDTLAGIRELTPGVRKMGARLTRRQRELVPMIVRGLTNKEIASHLNLSEQTVKNHIHRIFRRIGAIDRSEIIEIAVAEQRLN